MAPLGHRVCVGAVLSILLIAVLDEIHVPEPTEVPDRYEIYHCSGGMRSQGSAVINASILRGAGGGTNDAFLAIVDNACQHFHIEGPCDKVQRASTSAASAGCRYAVNGGPFSSFLSGGCIGPVLEHGKVQSEDWNSSFASVGLTTSGDWIIGHLSSTTASELGVIEAITGLGTLLVRNGLVQAPDAKKLAGRTGMGIDREGRLILLQVDGCERCPFSGGPSGLTLADFGALLVQHGAWQAINLDGGGSSVTISEGKVISRPTGLDIGVKVERPVTTIVCVK